MPAALSAFTRLGLVALALDLPGGALAFQFARPPLPRTTTRLHAEGKPRRGPYGFTLLFDCDGVLAETERDGHRVAFNQAFQEKGLGTEWDVELYGELLSVGGGKERMTAHWNKVGWPAGYETEDAQTELVKGLHARKTDIFNDMIKAGKIPLRPGVKRLIDEAIEAEVPIGVCSTSNERAVTTLVETLLGPERRAKMQIFAGDIVEKKKPAPDVYLLAKDTMGVEATRCMVIEDSHIGVKAAKAADMLCVVTMSYYTQNEDFRGAELIYDEIGEEPGITLNHLRAFASEFILA